MSFILSVTDLCKTRISKFCLLHFLCPVLVKLVLYSLILSFSLFGRCKRSAVWQSPNFNIFIKCIKNILIQRWTKLRITDLLDVGRGGGWYDPLADRWPWRKRDTLGFRNDLGKTQSGHMQLDFISDNHTFIIRTMTQSDNPFYSKLFY